MSATLSIIYKKKHFILPFSRYRPRYILRSSGSSTDFKPMPKNIKSTASGFARALPRFSRMFLRSKTKIIFCVQSLGFVEGRLEFGIELSDMGFGAQEPLRFGENKIQRNKYKSG